MMKPKVQKMDIGTVPPGKGRLWIKIFLLVLIYGGCILALFIIARIFRIFM